MPPTRSLAEELASKQRQISVAEFFERNRQILGFDNPVRAVLTTVKEAVDNSLDACEEAQVLPDITVEISKEGTDRLRVAVTDNGPGILKREIPNVFARLLYGSRFHANRQSRGQQGIGISAAVLYAGLTTARPARITSKVSEEEAAHVIELLLDTQKNLPRVVSEDLLLWDREHGTRIELVLKAKYSGVDSPRSTTSRGPPSSTPTPASSWSSRTAVASPTSGPRRSSRPSPRRSRRTPTGWSSASSPTT